MRESRSCVFCGEGPLTREHVYPQWLEAILPEQLRYRGQQASLLFPQEDSNYSVPSVFREVNQEFTQTVVKRTCKSCNSGWMNDLEERARNILTAMIQGVHFVATKSDNDALAIWVAKTCLMNQFTHPESLAMPQAYIDWIYTSKTPLPNMHIWAIPSCTDDWGVRSEHRGFLLSSSSNPDLSQPCNTHCTVIGLGCVAFWIIGTTTSGLFSKTLTELAPPPGIRIWPRGFSFEWNPEPCVGDEELWFLVDFLTNAGIVQARPF